MPLECPGDGGIAYENPDLEVRGQRARGEVRRADERPAAVDDEEFGMQRRAACPLTRNSDTSRCAPRPRISRRTITSGGSGLGAKAAVSPPAPIATVRAPERGRRRHTLAGRPSASCFSSLVDRS